MRWLRIDLDRKPDYPSAPGVYAIYLDGHLEYVGKAASLRSRLKDHGMLPGSPSLLTGRFKGARFSVAFVKLRICASDGDALRLERRLIKRLDPRLNVRKRVVAKTTTLHSGFSGDGA